MWAKVCDVLTWWLHRRFGRSVRSPATAARPIPNVSIWTQSRILSYLTPAGCQKRAADCSRLSERNSSNEYNHNFEGRYCTCEKGFDWNDPDNNEDMLQCVYCEDWFHPSCEALERFEKGSHVSHIVMEEFSSYGEISLCLCLFCPFPPLSLSLYLYLSRMNVELSRSVWFALSCCCINV